MKTELVQTRDLVEVYRMGETQIPALAGVTADIAKGEFVAVMGPSGSGKSTFMNVLGCLDRPTSGEYLLGGTPISKMSNDQLAAVRSRHRLRVPVVYAGVPTKQRREGATQMLVRVGIRDRAHHHPAQLSGGQQQRVAIARALVTQPLLILADEPTGALDSHTTLEIMTLFQELNRQGMTVVLVTHEADVARLARRILRFRDGRVMSDEFNSPAETAQAG